MNKYFPNEKGVTLIELIIYISIVTVVLIVTIDFAWLIIFGQVESQTEREVQQNGNLAMEKITRLIRQSSGVNHPLLGEEDNYVSLAMESPESDPTIISLFQERIVLSQREGGPVFLTNNRVRIEDLVFHNLSYSETPGTIKINIEVSNQSSGQLKPYQSSLSLQSSVSLMPGGTPSAESGFCYGEPSACDSYGESFSCTNQDGCSWHAGSCFGECESCEQLGLFQCFLYQDGCSWNFWRWRCEGSCVACEDITSWSDCRDQIGCSWDDAYCYGEAVSCEDFTTQVTCSAQEGCSWESL
ncbi:MAG: hypothetical protein GF370_04435 [Candidatus Nealsonbacteria bacterium]|nr:hypothetical protein [Candidatus Nealsonbacteria bacterium]